MKLSSLYLYRGDVDAALDVDANVLGLVSPDENPRLYLCARFNYASNLELAGRPQKARELLVYDAQLYEEEADEYTRVQVTWLEGRIAAALGESEEAERALLAARDHFVEREHGFNSARVCLHLASLYHREGRWEELQDAAAQAVQLFQAYALHQEALAALILLRDAASARQATAEMIQRIAGFLHKAERDPGARFETPN
jgi:tetratricopeptide (TPR) repeat protein